MSYKVKTKNYALTDSQKALAKKLDISQEFLRLLLGRGIAEEDVFDFLHPSIDKMSSPYEIDGMAEAVARIKRAIEKREKVLIYGDYDCDGICSIATLMLFLKDKVDAFYFIPNRHKDGYGISIDALDRVLYNQSPTLVITVDCGITAIDEVEYLKAKGIDVIVTDHHEPQQRIPDCIVVDPKVGRKGFYDLCGAGVALKLVEALSSREKASEYLDIAAIATIADVVPLKEDNRITAYYGLKRISQNPRKGIKMLMGNDNVCAQDVMFKLAPRMNAAGRLNSAMKVVGLFLEDDYFLLKTLAEELERDNSARQALCEKAVDEAKSMLKDVDFAKCGLITLYSENWDAGILGIACARLVEEFKRPVVLFAKLQNELKGSARSVPSVNIFELLCGLADIFSGFGGHAQAAGVSMPVEKFDEFKVRANEAVFSTHTLDDFKDSVTCEMQLGADTDFLKFAKELELLEPTGYQNPQPTFLLEYDGIKFDRIGFSQHVKYSGKNIDLLGFSRYASTLFGRTGKVDIEVVLGTNVFQNRVSAQGIIRSLQFQTVNLSSEDSDTLNVHQLQNEGSCKLQNISIERIEELIDEGFGTLVVCFSRQEYDELCKNSNKIAQLPVYIANTKCLNPENAILICPSAEFDFSFYKQVIVAGTALCEGYLKAIKDNSKACFACCEKQVESVRITDDTLRRIYKEIATLCARTPKMQSLHKMYLEVCARFKMSERDFTVALDIFNQLGLVRIGERGVVDVSRKAVSLQNSVTYRNLLH